jgi:MFS family permease
MKMMAFINMGYMFGMLVGSFVFGIISDKIGRRKALLLSAILAGSTSLGSAFIKSYWPYFVMSDANMAKLF